MTYLRGFFSFWYQLIVGDDWLIAVMVGVALGLGALSAALEIVTGAALAVVISVLLVAGFTLDLLRFARTS